jgi:hypothetical protein
MMIRPITFRAASAFVNKLHRHNEAPRGHKFSISVVDTNGEIAGVVMVGRPVARAFDDGLTIEVNRSCTDGARNVNSMLYGAAVRASKAMGYARVITYTQGKETGASVRAAGFVRVRDLPARKGWAASSVKLRGIRDPVGTGGVKRTLWQIVFAGNTVTLSDRKQGKKPETGDRKQENG